MGPTLLVTLLPWASLSLQGCPTLEEARQSWGILILSDGRDLCLRPSEGFASLLHLRPPFPVSQLRLLTQARPSHYHPAQASHSPTRSLSLFHPDSYLTCSQQPPAPTMRHRLLHTSFPCYPDPTALSFSALHVALSVHGLRPKTYERPEWWEVARACPHFTVWHWLGRGQRPIRATEKGHLIARCGTQGTRTMAQ